MAIRGIRGRHYETAKSALEGLTLPRRRLGSARGPRERHFTGGFMTETESALVSRSRIAGNVRVANTDGPARRTDELGPAAALFLASDASSYVTGATWSWMAGTCAGELSGGSMSLPIVAIVGRPNVGKSSLFNWLAGRRISIVDPTAGVTRDRVRRSSRRAGGTSN